MKCIDINVFYEGYIAVTRSMEQYLIEAVWWRELLDIICPIK